MFSNYSILPTAVYLTNWSSTFSILGQFFSLIFIFILILLLTYFTTKILAGYKIKSITKGNINIIETLPMGTNHIHIVKVGEQFFLISSSKDGVRLLSEIDPKNVLLKENFEKDTTKETFKEYFNLNLGKFKNKGDN